MDVLTGKFKPQGKLPFALANNPEAILRQDPDAPGYADAGHSISIRLWADFLKPNDLAVVPFSAQRGRGSSPADCSVAL